MEKHDNYFLKGEILYRLVDDFEPLVVPKGVQREVIRTIHEKGHFGHKKMKEHPLIRLYCIADWF